METTKKITLDLIALCDQEKIEKLKLANSKFDDFNEDDEILEQMEIEIYRIANDISNQLEEDNPGLMFAPYPITEGGCLGFAISNSGVYGQWHQSVKDDTFSETYGILIEDVNIDFNQKYDPTDIKYKWLNEELNEKILMSEN